MVVFLDLEDELQDPHADPRSSNHADPKQQLRHSMAAGSSTETMQVDYDRPNPNVNSFSAALGCYPYVSTAPPSNILPRI